MARRARDQLAEVTGLQPESVSSLERAEDGSWFVTVELLELERVPSTDDVLGSYEARVDEDGELLGYRRLRRYARSHAYEQSG
nr:gas vesicle protein [Conexibacter arvalis]